MLIGIAGAARSGKDTTGIYIRKFIPEAQKVSFAAPIKRFAEDVFGFSSLQLYGSSSNRDVVDTRFADKRTWDQTHNRYAQHRVRFAMECLCFGADSDNIVGALNALDRWFLQHIVKFNGDMTARHVLQTLGTECGRNFCQDVWVGYLKKTVASGIFYAPDVRFENEMKLCANPGNQLWWIERKGAGLSGNHESESYVSQQELKDRYATHTYDNSYTLAELQDWVRNRCLLLAQ